MEQLRPESIEITNNTTVLEQPVNMLPPVTKTVDMNNISETDNKFKFDIFSNDINTDFVKKRADDAKPEADNRNTQYINPGAQQNGSTASALSSFKSKDELRGGVKATLMVLDYFVSLLAMKITKSKRTDEYTPTASQSRLNEDTIVEFLYGKSIQIPPWMAMTFALVGSYGMILIAAFKNRKPGNVNLQTLPIETVPYKTPSQVEAEKKAAFANVQPIPVYKQPAPVLYQEYNVAKDGTAIPSTRDKQSSPLKPDIDLIANNLNELRDYVAKGMYPQFRRNTQGKPIKVNYHADGTPKIAGNVNRAVKRK